MITREAVDAQTVGPGASRGVYLPSVAAQAARARDGRVLPIARAITPEFVSYDFENWCDLPPGAGDQVIHTPTMSVCVPKVIQLVHYDKLPSREVRFTRRNIFYRDRNRCQYCGKTFPQREINLDHVKPISRGGTSRWENVVCACIRCNTQKGDRLPEDRETDQARAFSHSATCTA